MLEGWIKLYRELLRNCIWEDSTSEQKVILITLLLMANYRDVKHIWKGKKYDCKPGEFITSYNDIIKHAGKDITIQNIRTCLKKLMTAEFLTYQSTDGNGGGIKVIINNWSTYQSNDQQDDQQEANRLLTGCQQVEICKPAVEANPQLPKKRRRKEENNSSRVEEQVNDLFKKENNYLKIGEFGLVEITQEEYNKLLAFYVTAAISKPDEALKELIEDFDSYLARGKTVEGSHYAELKAWFSYRKKNGKLLQPKTNYKNSSSTPEPSPTRITDDALVRALEKQAEEAVRKFREQENDKSSKSDNTGSLNATGNGVF